MKYCVGLIGIFLLLSCTLKAQKSQVLSAYKHYELYLSEKKCNELSLAKQDVDAAAGDIQTAQWAKTWFYRGNIYFDIAVSDQPECFQLSGEALNIAYASYKRSLDLDVKQYYTTDIHTRLAVIGPSFLNRGVKFYNESQFDKALESFIQSSDISKLFDKVDTLALYNAALSAEQLKSYDTAAHLYQQLIDIRYGEGEIQRFLANLHRSQGDTVAQLKALINGRKMYPNNKDLVVEELNYYLEHATYEPALLLIEEMIKKDASNPLMYYYQGAIYENLKRHADAETAYSNAVLIDPDYFDALYNLGVLFFNEGVELNEDAFSENGSEAKRNAAKKKFEQALPYLEKANNINHFDRSTLVSLQKIYSILGDDEGYQRVTEELEN
jgi:tetratricopeptide (TPR) repeat protein